MSGIQEILLVVLLVLALLVVPRVLKRGGGAAPKPPRRRHGPSGRLRLALLLSVLWPLTVGLLRNPFSGNPRAFVYLGIAPVLLAWALAWVAAGFRRPERKK